VSFTDWLLFLHIASAFALVAALVTFWSVAIAARNVDRPVDFPALLPDLEAGEHPHHGRHDRHDRLRDLARDRLRRVQGLGRMDPDRDRALAIAAGTGQRGGMNYQQAAQLAGRLDAENRGAEPSAELKALLQNRQAMWLTIVSSVAVLLILIDMIYKPGA
jgi:hypothetical protein